MTLRGLRVVEIHGSGPERSENLRNGAARDEPHLLVQQFNLVAQSCGSIHRRAVAANIG
jgi:hypothetical protein